MPAKLFQPGQSGNPSGKPKGAVSLKTLLTRALRSNGRDRAKEMIDAMIEDAIQGKDSAAKNKAREMIWEYIDGKVPDRVEHGGAGGGPLTVVLGWRDGDGD